MAWVNHDIEPDSADDDRQESTPPTRRLPGCEDPSLPFLRIGGLLGRIHWIVPLYLACELVAWLPERKPGPMQMGGLIGSLLVLPIAQELGRGLLARRLGSTSTTSPSGP